MLKFSVVFRGLLSDAEKGGFVHVFVDFLIFFTMKVSKMQDKDTL